MAQPGDWVVGTGSKSNHRDNYLVYAMEVTEALTFDEYWLEPRFSCKRPILAGSKKQAFGDNIYHRDSSSSLWTQEDSHHSHGDGSPNWNNINRDTSTNRVLVSKHFVYWGRDGPQIPARFRNYSGFDLCARRGYKCRFPDALVRDVIAWIKSLRKDGYIGKPLDWKRSS